MYVVSKSFPPYAFIPERYAFGKHDPENHFAFAGNRNPHLAWGDVPEGTQSFAIICNDPDVPSVGDDVNQEGKVVPVELPRSVFFHWVLVDVPGNVREIKEGMHSLGIIEGGKEPSSPDGGVVGVNDYTDWFKGQEGMEGTYYGYDGPAPPWNDARVHAYHFTVFALDVKSLGLSGSFSGHKAMRALRSHVLTSASHVGLYAINPDARKSVLG
jgi:Raf kinase inhibitor-like YbhB/YbcL family protein